MTTAMATKTKKPTKKSTKKPAKKAVAKKKTAKKPVAKKPAAKKSASKPAPRADFGKPIDGFLAKQPPTLRAIVEALRAMIEEAAPTAQASAQVGHAVLHRRRHDDGRGRRAQGARESDPSWPGRTYDDPDGLLVGEGTTGKHMKLASVDQIPKDTVRGWLETAAKRVGG